MSHGTKPHLPAIVVVGYNRPRSLKRLLGALAKAHYPDAQVPLVISIDHGDNADVLQVAEAFEWKHGEKIVRYQPENLGLRPHILKCGDLTQEYGSIILLEDDLYVAPHFYQYAAQALDYYEDDPRVAGVSLYTIQQNDFASGLPFDAVADGSDVFFVQMPCSWGQAWTAKWWKGFRTWMENAPKIQAEDLLPNTVKEHWPETSWVKYQLKYLVDHGYYFVYPRTSYSTNFGDTGTHFDEAVNTYQVKMQWAAPTPRFVKQADSLSIYDSFYDLDPDCVKRLVPELADYDFIVDLYRIKNWALFPAEHVLTLGQAKGAVMQFAAKLQPLMMNVVAGIPGEDIALARKSDFLPLNGQAMQPYMNHYAQVPMRALLALLKRRLRARLPF